MGGQQGVAGHLRWHLALAPDAMREDRAQRCARGARATPEGDPTEPETEGRRVTCQAPATATGGLVLEPTPPGQDARRHQCEKRLAVAKELTGGRLVLKIDGDGAVFSCRFGRWAPV